MARDSPLVDEWLGNWSRRSALCLECSERLGTVLHGNAAGLYNTVGNAWEWCADYFDPAWHVEAARLDPVGPPSGDRPSCRIVRAGFLSSAIRGTGNNRQRHAIVSCKNLRKDFENLRMQVPIIGQQMRDV